jgi:Rrf2 family transcriptional regulator, nitric oxide-sensitive transcriptional repressor
MRLTKFSDYALRVLIYAASTPGRRTTVEETANAYAISRAHLKKVVMMLIKAGFLTGVRGRTGGYTLARPPEAINLGAVLRATEPDFAVVECLSASGRCRIAHCCRLAGIAGSAVAAFVGAFDQHTLADVVVDHSEFLPPPAVARSSIIAPVGGEGGDP